MKSRRRSAERVYLGLLVGGIALPYGQAVPWFRKNGLDVRRFFDELFATRISSFFGWDAIVASATVVVLAGTDDQLTPAQRLLVATGGLGGSSVGLPLYLWLTERNRRMSTA